MTTSCGKATVVPFVRECVQRTCISVTNSQSFVPKTCRTCTDNSYMTADF